VAGGETPVVPNRELTDAIDPAVRARMKVGPYEVVLEVALEVVLEVV
jgi:hypothetical protein